MARIRRLGTLIASTVVAGALIAPAGASGDGLPVPGGVDTTHQGVLSPDGGQRYLAIAGDGATVVERIDAANGVLQASRWLDGEYAVPGVTIGGDTAGLSHDGSSLVLIRPRVRFPQSRTAMILLDPESLEVRRTIELDGDFSFDAISPDGEAAFLIQYPDPKDPTDYRLRALELDSGRLVPGAILPENDPEEEMRGFPLARATGPEGRWEYTLYDGGSVFRYRGGKPGEPFVHAIDTVERRTLCIDLDWITPRQVTRVSLQLSDDGSQVEVVEPQRGVIGVIDTATGEASEVSEPAPADDDAGASIAAAGDDGGGGDGALVALAGLGAAAALGFATALVRRRRGRGRPVGSAAA